MYIVEHYTKWHGKYVKTFGEFRQIRIFLSIQDAFMHIRMLLKGETPINIEPKVYKASNGDVYVIRKLMEPTLGEKLKILINKG